MLQAFIVSFRFLFYFLSFTSDRTLISPSVFYYGSGVHISRRQFFSQFAVTPHCIIWHILFFCASSISSEPHTLFFLVSIWLFINLLLTYLLTYSMVQSPPWEANWFAASQEIHRISRNPKVHYRTHKRPPPVSILGQPNSVHISTSHLLEIHPNIIQPSTPRSPHWSLSLRLPHQEPIHPPLLTNTRHMTSPPHIYTPLGARFWLMDNLLS